ncbi:MAG: ABC transporter ATP-binding protein [Clostridia bacterium]|nr:ABC transporter ATP-binding protein [Clostridia bacterium]
MFKNMKTLKTLLKYLGKARYLVALSLLFALVTVALTLYIPVLTGQAVDLALGKGDVDISGIGFILIKISACAILLALFQWLLSVVNNRLSFDTARDVRIAAFKKIGRLKVKTIDSRPVGDTLSRVITDIDHLSDGVLMGLTQVFTGVITIVATLVFMVSMNGWIALAVVIVTPLSFVVSGFVARRTYSMFRAQAGERSEITRIVDETIGGMRTVQAFSREKDMVESFDAANERLKKCSLRAIFFSSITNPSTRFVNSVVYALVAVCGSLMSVFGVGALSIGDLTCFLSYASQYTKPFNEISSVVAEFQNALACAARVFEFIDGEELEKEDAGQADLTKVEGRVEFKNLSFSYDPKKPLIENLNLTALPGQKIAIVGPTGCGKTTLINLLMRFYEPDEGEILIDGISATDYTRSDLRSLFGMVLQDTWLRAGTVMENIKYANPVATDDMAIEAAKQARAHGFITRLPNGYDTVLTEDGGGLSQGQKQLLCIARVMLRDPKMLILDEATSSIDTRTEMRIQDAFARLMAGRTSFVVAHRLSTIRTADKIVAMKDGKIMEIGTHEELIKKNGFYHDLYMSQYR